MLKKINDSKIALWVLPHLSYIISLLLMYSVQDKYKYELLFEDILVVGAVFVVLVLIIELVLFKVYKNDTLVVSVLYTIGFFLCAGICLNVFSLAVVVVILLILYLLRKKLIISNSIVSFLIVISSLVIAAMSIATLINRRDIIFNKDISKVEIKDFFVDKTLESPNIYYIHCDGMPSIGTMEKYFNYNDEKLIEYFENNDFLYNSTASFVANHQTQKALVALFNPNYYDKKERKFLEELDNSFVNGSSIKHYISYDEMYDKRMNNELFLSLKQKGYKTYAISKYNQYSSLDVDEFYDMFSGNDTNKYVTNNKHLYKISNNNSKEGLLKHIERSRRRALWENTIFGDLFNNYALNVKEIKINDNIIKEYNNISNSIDWTSRAILTGLEEVKEEQEKFIFIDFDNMHMPISYDKNGNKIANGNTFRSYLGNYYYNTSLLIDILNYIKKNDKEAIIIMQGDHGIHMQERGLMKYLGISKREYLTIANSTINAVYIPQKYINGDESMLKNPLNISRYIVNNFVGENYTYLK